MDKKVRRLLAANGWLGISVLVVTVVLIIVLSCFSENDLMTEMLDAFVDTVGQPSDTSPDYGGVVLVIVGVFFVFGALGMQLFTAPDDVSMILGVVVIIIALWFLLQMWWRNEE